MWTFGWRVSCALNNRMEFTVKPSPSDTTSNECKEILAELITATNELRSHIRFQGATPQDADDGSSVLGTYDPNRLEPLYRCIKRIFTHKILTFSEKVSAGGVWILIAGLVASLFFLEIWSLFKSIHNGRTLKSQFWPKWYLMSLFSLFSFLLGADSWCLILEG